MAKIVMHFLVPAPKAPAPHMVSPVGEPVLMMEPPSPLSIIRRTPYLQQR